MKFTESPVNGRPGRRVGEPGPNMPLHLPGVLMSSAVTQFQPYRPPSHLPTLAHRTSSLEMLNNVNDFEEKRAFIASTLSLNDLLKSSQPPEWRAGSVGASTAQFSPLMGKMSSSSSQPPVTSNGYVVPQSLLKPNTNGYNVNFLNNGTPDKDLGKFENIYKLRKLIHHPSLA